MVMARTDDIINTAGHRPLHLANGRVLAGHADFADARWSGSTTP